MPEKQADAHLLYSLPDFRRYEYKFQTLLWGGNRPEALPDVQKLYSQIEKTAKEYKCIFQALPNAKVHINKLYSFPWIAPVEINYEQNRMVPT